MYIIYIEKEIEREKEQKKVNLLFMEDRQSTQINTTLE